jgi:hypothetical protein
MNYIEISPEYSENYDISNTLLPFSYSEKRVCEWPNYIAKPSRKRPIKELWELSYNEQLYEMENIIILIMEKQFPDKIDWNKPSIYNNLSTLIYHCSSKHYLKDYDL